LIFSLFCLLISICFNKLILYSFFSVSRLVARSVSSFEKPKCNLKFRAKLCAFLRNNHNFQRKKIGLALEIRGNNRVFDRVIYGSGLYLRGKEGREESWIRDIGVLFIIESFKRKCF